MAGDIAFLDTSILLEGLIELRRDSAAMKIWRAIASARLEAATAWHCCLEFYSVSTRLPEEFRLPPQDALKALEELAHWHESLSLAEGFAPAQRIELLLLVDDAAQPRARKLTRDYLGQALGSRFQENRLWTALHEYWRQAGLAFARGVDLFLQAAKGAEAARGTLPLLLARALRAAAQQIKWMHMRYGPYDYAVWGVLNRVYAFAESRRLAQASVTLYPGLNAQSTPSLEFARAALFSAAGPEGLLPAEIDLADRTVTVGPGISMLRLNEELKQYGVLFPDTPASYPCSLVGGRIACSGFSLLGTRFGHTRDLVMSFEIVLPTGEIIRVGDGGGKKIRKSSTGYHLKHLFMGHQGTLGIVTEATLELVPRPEAEFAAFFAFDDFLNAHRTVHGIVTSGIATLAGTVLFDEKKVEYLRRDDEAFIPMPPWVNSIVATALYGTKAEVREASRILMDLGRKEGGRYTGDDLMARGALRLFDKPFQIQPLADELWGLAEASRRQSA